MAEQSWRSLAPIIAMGLVAAASSYALGQADLWPRPSSDLMGIEFALEDVSYQVLVPKRSWLSNTNNPGCVKIWHPHAVRTMTFLELCSASGAIPGPFERRATLTDGVRVRYNVNHDIGGGSGGTEGELNGELDLNGKVFVLTCRDQDERRNDPEWCLHYLRYLEVRDRK